MIKDIKRIREEIYQVHTDEEYNQYVRHSATCWYLETGDDDIRISDCKELEMAFQEFMRGDKLIKQLRLNAKPFELPTTDIKSNGEKSRAAIELEFKLKNKSWEAF